MDFGSFNKNLSERVIIFEQISRLHPHFLGNLASIHANLRRRELEICALLILHCSNGEIAERLGVDLHTIESAKCRIKKKLGVANGLPLISYLYKFTVLLMETIPLSRDSIPV